MTNRPNRTPHLRLHLAGALSLTGYLAMAWVTGSRVTSGVLLGLSVWAAVFVIYGCLVVAVLKRSPSSTTEVPRTQRSRAYLWAILLWALVFRVVLLFAGLPANDLGAALRADLSGQEAGYQPFLLWDNDVWRYLWEGHMVAEGSSPYALAPLEVLDASDAGQPWAEVIVEQDPWIDVLDRMSYTQFPSVYPPAALALFRISHWLAPGSVLTWKTMLVVAEFSGCLLFLLLLAKSNRPPEWVLLLAWNPLLIKEVAGSGHIDGTLVALSVATLLAWRAGRKTLAVSALTIAVLIKLWPLLLAPAILVRSHWSRWWPLPLGLSLGFWPFRNDLLELSQTLQTFAGQWVFNPGPWLGLEWLAHSVGGAGRGFPDSVHKLVTLSAVAATTLFAWRRSPLPSRDPSAPTPDALHDLSRDWFLIGAIYLLLSATVMPWYLAALLPVAILMGAWPWLVVTAASLLSYGIYFDGVERGWVLAIEYLIVACAFAGWTWKLRQLRSTKKSLTSGPRLF